MVFFSLFSRIFLRIFSLSKLFFLLTTTTLVLKKRVKLNYSRSYSCANHYNVLLRYCLRYNTMEVKCVMKIYKIMIMSSTVKRHKIHFKKDFYKSCNVKNAVRCVHFTTSAVISYFIYFLLKELKEALRFTTVGNEN